MTAPRIVFFGSTPDSVLVLEKLHASGFAPVAVVTQPAKPVGRKQIMTETPVALWAATHNTTTLSFPTSPDKPWLYEHEETVIDALEPLRADLIISASYGQRIPAETIRAAKHGGLNVHPSVLPRWRGADPVPWAILTGDHQAGVTVVTLSETFDEGRIMAQKKIPIRPQDTADPLRTRLFALGADLLVELLPEYIAGKAKGMAQKPDTTYARRLTRKDGFEPWDAIMRAMTDPNEAARLDRKFRAFVPWPGVWTMVKDKRLKIIACHREDERLIIDTIQWEGKTPMAYSPLTEV